MNQSATMKRIATRTADEVREHRQTKFDRTARIGKAQIQYGPVSDRVYVMRWNGADPEHVLPRLQSLAESENLGKIIAKIPISVAPGFLDAGYRLEAGIPGYYGGREAAVFMGRYPDRSRRHPENREKLEHVLILAAQNASESEGDVADFKSPDLELREATRDDIGQMATIYRKVFETYPFPIHEPAYLLDTMNQDVRYFAAVAGDRLVALSSAEMDPKRLGVEMTDFATLPEWRGRGLASLLLDKMEIAMRQSGMRTAYTIARAPSAGINIVFARKGYDFGGTLVNNTNIAGTIESMNVWHKNLAESGVKSY